MNHDAVFISLACIHRCGAPLQAGLIQKEDIIVDAKSGVSGAGRSAKVNLLYTEVAEGLNCYGITRHRHMPEIEQVLPPPPAAEPCSPCCSLCYSLSH